MTDYRRAAVLELGERLSEPPSTHLVDFAFGAELAAQRGLAEMVGWVDLAHTLCLIEAAVIPRDAGRQLIGALMELQHAADFEPRPEFGDLYTNREAWLGQKTPAVGWLGVARARREALTTAYHLTLCDALCALCDALTTAIDALSAVSDRYKNSVMPDYTYLQAAQPTTFGHYLQSFAWPMLRDVERALALHARADQCPAGIGSSNGSILPQDRWRLAKRLGFAAPVRHARDAMWMQDLAIEACAVACAASINLSRLAEDLIFFASAEFGFVRLADRHCRASKIMPQKRNPFALAFVRATANRLIGVQAGVSATGRTPSGQMDNRLYVYDAAPESLTASANAALLVADCLEGLAFVPARAAQALADRSVCASDLTERLTGETGLDYRRAHGVVGSLVTQLEEEGRSLADVAPEELVAVLRLAGVDLDDAQSDAILTIALDPVRGVTARTGLGCAASEEVGAMADELATAARKRREEVSNMRGRRKAAIDSLLAEARVVAETPT